MLVLLYEGIISGYFHLQGQPHALFAQTCEQHTRWVLHFVQTSIPKNAQIGKHIHYIGYAFAIFSKNVQNPFQTVTICGCLGFLIMTCGFFRFPDVTILFVEIYAGMRMFYSAKLDAQPEKP